MAPCGDCCGFWKKKKVVPDSAAAGDTTDQAIQNFKAKVLEREATKRQLYKKKAESHASYEIKIDPPEVGPAIADVTAPPTPPTPGVSQCQAVVINASEPGGSALHRDDDVPDVPGSLQLVCG